MKMENIQLVKEIEDGKGAGIGSILDFDKTESLDDEKMKGGKDLANCEPRMLTRKNKALRISVPKTPTYEFMKFCFKCNKELQDNDIYIYRGEWSFCSVGCRNSGIKAKLGTPEVKSELLSTGFKGMGGVIFSVGD